MYNIFRHVKCKLLHVSPKHLCTAFLMPMAKIFKAKSNCDHVICCVNVLYIQTSSTVVIPEPELTFTISKSKKYTHNIGHKTYTWSSLWLVKALNVL